MISKYYKTVSALLIFTGLSFSGCTSYTPPGKRADFQILAPQAPAPQNDTSTGTAAQPQPQFQAVSAEPTAQFPVGIVWARVQASNYSNYYIQRNGGKYGEGLFSIIMSKELGEDKQYERMAALPKVADVIGLNRILLPQRLDKLEQVRNAAAQLQAGMVFLYTVDTTFHADNSSKTLATISLGMARTKKITATSTISALLMDTKTGYIYSAYETTEREEISSSSWSTNENADKARQKTESRAFEKLIDEMIAGWPKLLKHYRAK